MNVSKQHDSVSQHQEGHRLCQLTAPSPPFPSSLTGTRQLLWLQNRGAQGKKRGGVPSSLLIGARPLQSAFYPYLSTLHQSELDHTPISKSIRIHREWDYHAWFRLFTSHFPAQRGVGSHSGQDTELKMSRFFKVNEKGGIVYQGSLKSMKKRNGLVENSSGDKNSQEPLTTKEQAKGETQTSLKSSNLG